MAANTIRTHEHDPDVKNSATEVDRELEQLALQILQNHNQRDLNARFQELARWRRNNLVNLPSLDD